MQCLPGKRFGDISNEVQGWKGLILGIGGGKVIKGSFPSILLSVLHVVIFFLPFRYHCVGPNSVSRGRRDSRGGTRHKTVP